MTILVVEDVDLVRLVLVRMLKTGGHEVVEASDAADARQILARRGCKVLLTDLWMRGEGGIALIEHARSRFPDLNIIAITGGAPFSTTEFSIEAAKKAGARSVLVKPVSKDELLQAVADAARA